MLVELQTDNLDGALKPGAFAEVSFVDAHSGGGDLTVPGSSVLYTNNGPAVVLVDGRNRVTVKPIEITRDAGTVVSIAGLSANDRVVDTPPDAIRTGDQVRIAGKGAPHAS